MKKALAIIGILFVSVFFLSNDSRCDQKMDGQRATVEGRLQMIGNEPFTLLAILTESGQQVRLPEEDRERFRAYQGREVRMTGVIRERKITTADGKQTFTEWFLTEPEFVE